MDKLRASWLLAAAALAVGLVFALNAGDDEEFPADDPIEIDV